MKDLRDDFKKNLLEASRSKLDLLAMDKSLKLFSLTMLVCHVMSSICD